MTQIQESPGRAERVQDVLTIFVLSVTAVLTAWCGFESSKWGGEMSIAFSQASSQRVQATNAESEARDDRQFDLLIYANWLAAEAEGKTELADYVEERFTDTFRVAFDAWVADGMQEGSPFEREEYVPPSAGQAAELTKQADASYQRALTNNQRGDNYSLLTVLFALVLFLGAMSQRDTKVWITRVFLGFAIIAGAVGIVILASLPIKI